MKKLLIYFLFLAGIFAFAACSEGVLDDSNESINGGVGKQTVLGPITLKLESVTGVTAQFSGSLDMSTVMLYTEIGIIYSTESDLSQNSGTRVQIKTIINNNQFLETISPLPYNSEIYYAPYYCTATGLFVVGNINSFRTSDPYKCEQKGLSIDAAVNLSDVATANCYIVSQAGLYKFKTVKGNSNVSVGQVASGEILWESFGTSTAPMRGELINAFAYMNGYIVFKTSDSFRGGNAVIAAKDAKGKILWSWHIWFTEAPQQQIYYDSRATMMDRNLGAYTATKGLVSSLGLLYQWGRKDPFLNASSISGRPVAQSTIEWPKHVMSDSKVGTMSYAIANPTTFIASENDAIDWLDVSDDSCWSSQKTIYDPCPVGWRVPDGGESGVWSAAASLTKYTIDSSNMGMNFYNVFSSGYVWYPFAGELAASYGTLNVFGLSQGTYWSSTPSRELSYYFGIVNEYGWVHVNYEACRAYGFSVRCQKEW